MGSQIALAGRAGHVGRPEWSALRKVQRRANWACYAPFQDGGSLQASSAELASEPEAEAALPPAPAAAHVWGTLRPHRVTVPRDGPALVTDALHIEYKQDFVGIDE